MTKEAIEKEYTIKILTREVKKSDGKGTFTAFKCVENDGTLVDLSFTKAVKNIPTENGMLTVKASNINKQTNKHYPKYWVKDVEKFEPLQRGVNTKALDDAFGDSDTDPVTSLPF